MKTKVQTIELDCAPGAVRPGDLLIGVLEGTGIDPKEPISKFFGNWEWDFNDVDKKVWKKAHPTIVKRITALYNAGRIRYASW